MQIDKSKPVLVTGATGYVAGWIVKRLLEDGITVHAAVRNPDSKAKLAHLDKLAVGSEGSIKYFKSDLLPKKGHTPRQWMAANWFFIRHHLLPQT